MHPKKRSAVESRYDSPKQVWAEKRPSSSLQKAMKQNRNMRLRYIYEFVDANTGPLVVTKKCYH